MRKETLPGSLLLEQAQSAVWLLCHFGGAGSKSRKGFGSFADPEQLGHWTKREVDEAAERFRSVWREHKLGFGGGDTGSPSLKSVEDSRLHFDLETPWTNYWFVLDRAGTAAQRFAQRYKHNVEKKALGLPRRVQPPVSGKFRAGKRAEKSDRHASPVRFPPVPRAERQIPYPRDRVPVARTSHPGKEPPISRGIPGRIAGGFGGRLRRPIGVSTHAALDPATDRVNVASPGSAGPERGTAVPKAGDRVDAVLIDEVTNRGGRKARHGVSGLVGPIQNFE